MSRTRSLAVSLGEGHAQSNDGWVSYTVPLTKSSVCHDVVGNYGGANPLVIEHKLSHLFVRNGWDYRPTAGSAVLFENYPCIPGSWFRHEVAKTAPPSDNSALANALARSNPNRPNVDVPVFLFELREIPGLIKDWGNDLLKSRDLIVSRKVDLRKVPRVVGKKYLEYQFGVMPFIKDVMGMLNFQANVQKKLNALDDMQHGVLRRKTTVWTDSSVSGWYNYYVTALYREATKFRFKMETSRHRWVSTRWTTDMPLPSNDQDRYLLATRLAYGLDISLSTLWEAMPWSWLIDWFSNIGDLVASGRNTIPVSHGGSCIMETTSTGVSEWEFTYTPAGHTDTVRPLPGVLVNKTRVAAPLFSIPEFNLPFLTGSQLSILSALTVVKGGHYRK